jgi:2-polyprenyl-3-methyl-5-hydroxy-6-metoxy-1,4-benzoquinol methylase
MNGKVVVDYGWNGATAPSSCEYIAPQIINLLVRLKAKRVLDLGAGNGALCSMLDKHGFEAVGVEYDKRGVEVARSFYPHIPFYSFGVQDEPNEQMSGEKPFDAAVSTEVVVHLFSPHMLPIYARPLVSDTFEVR